MVLSSQNITVVTDFFKLMNLLENATIKCMLYFVCWWRLCNNYLPNQTETTTCWQILTDAMIISVHRGVTHIIPGRYGYGKAPPVASLPKVKGQAPRWDQSRRQRRSAPARVHHSGFRGQGVSRSNKLLPPSGPHHYSPSYTQPRAQQPKYNRVWAPLYQPGSTMKAQDQQEEPSGSGTLEKQNQERPYSPLPTSHCRGEPSHHRVCRNQVRSISIFFFFFFLFCLFFVSLHRLQRNFREKICF